MDLLWHSSPLMGRYSIVRFIHSCRLTDWRVPLVFPRKNRQLTDRFIISCDTSVHLIHLQQRLDAVLIPVIDSVVLVENKIIDFSQRRIKDIYSFQMWTIAVHLNNQMISVTWRILAGINGEKDSFGIAERHTERQTFP